MSKRSPRLLFTDEELAAPELKKAVKKADKAYQKLEKAEAKIPKKTVKRKQRTVDPQTGRVTTRLSFEEVDKKRPPSKLTHALRDAPGAAALSAVQVEGFSPGSMTAAWLALLCAVVSILFCRGLHGVEHLLKRTLKNPYLRVAVGAAVLIGLTLLTNGDYNGAGMEVIGRAIAGQADPWAWVWKLLFTAITIGCGFKGGEVVPSFFVGAPFGSVAGQALGLPGGFGAAIGLVAVFCGAVNCPIASVLLSLELFGGTDGVLYFAFACAISYLLSGYCGLYSSQTILYSKLRAEFINVHAKE